ncbi:hypothetical protein VNI00_002361 [Paramarasmius palmivorus]|uniref:DNA damage-binding protein 1 n=1 Tax=Paramarasmius palmivorus TaxID=297713 RepID=A0AAW0DZF8_9AGAR
MDVMVHPKGEVAVVSCYAGRLKVLKLKAGHIEFQTDVQIAEINLLSLAFLPLPVHQSKSKLTYTIALLHVNHMQQLHLVSHDLVISDSVELSYDPSLALPPTTIAQKWVPYPTETLPRLVSLAPQDSFLGGILVVGGRKILLYELSSEEDRQLHEGKKKRLNKRKSGTDEEEKEKAKEKEKARENKKRRASAEVEWPWSQTPPAQTISYLDNQVFYVGSHLGDSQVIKLHQNGTSNLEPTLPIPPETQGIRRSSDKGKKKAKEDNEDLFDESLDLRKGRVIELTGKYLSVFQTFKNIAPIADAILVDLDDSGQQQLVTCSGGKSSGSLNIIRMGANFQELAILPGFEQVTNIWPLRGTFYGKHHTHLVVSTLSETYIFRVESDQSFSYLNAHNSFALGTPTICAHNLIKRDTSNNYSDSSYAIQVTPRGAVILEYDSRLDQWLEISRQLPKQGNVFVAASVNSSQVVLASSKGILDAYVIEYNNGAPLLKSTISQHLMYSDSPLDDPAALPIRSWLQTEISAISVAPLKDSDVSTRFIGIAFWTTNQIKVYRYTVHGLKVQFQSMPLPAMVRSLLFFDFGRGKTSEQTGHHPCLIAGLSNGSVVSFVLDFEWKKQKNGPDYMVLKGFKDMKIVSLGVNPVCLSVCPVEGKRAVIASGSRSTILSWERSRVHYSPVVLKDVTAVSALNSTGYPSSLILADKFGIKIGRVQDTDKMHVQTIPFGLDNPHRIAHIPSLKVFGVAVDHTEPYRIGDDEDVVSSFKLLDDQQFRTISTFECQNDEQAMSLTTIKVSVADEDATFFCMGTTFIDPGETEPRRGRIVILGASGHSLSLAASEDTNGCVYALSTVSGLLAAAVGSSVVVYWLEVSLDKSTNTIILEGIRQASEWNHNYLVTSIASYGNRLVVADQFSSVSLLELTSGTKLSTIARDYSPLWPISVDAFNEKTIIGSDDTLNLFSFTVEQAGGRKVLRRDGYYHVGDVVTKFLRGSIALPTKAATEAGMRPTHMFCTASGRIGVVIDELEERLSNDLTLIEIGMSTLLTEQDDEKSHRKHRAPRNARGRTDADEAAFGFLDGDFLEKLLTLMDESPNDANKVLGTSNETLGAILSDKQAIHQALETLQNMH